MRVSQYKAWGLLTPTLAILFFIGLVPFIYVVYLSLYKYNIFSLRGMVFTGVGNFRKLMFDPDFMHSLRIGLTFVVITCVAEMFLGLAIALFLTNEFVGKGVFRTILALPLAIAPITIGSIWVLMTNPDIGPLPYLLHRVGINYNIGVSARQAFFTTILMDIWHWTPFVTLTLLAGLTSFPKEPFEAAKVDGASKWQVLRYLTIPLLTPVILTMLFIRIMDTFRIFDEVWMLTSGGPGTATRYVSIHVVRLVLSSTDYGYGSSMSVFLLYLTIVMCWLLLNIISVVRRETREA
ncbi:sugar ABC transporter permease [Patescibacteria group bacterium]|nr:sugar ABC transporter permease [Patescibacteria group bacterium]